MVPSQVSGQLLPVRGAKSGEWTVSVCAWCQVGGVEICSLCVVPSQVSGQLLPVRGAKSGEWAAAVCVWCQVG